MNKIKYTFTISFLSLFLASCSFNPFGVGGIQATNMSSETDQQNLDHKVVNPYAVLSAEEILKGFSSVTQVVPDNNIMNEYNARNAILATSNNMKEVTAPMLIGITNLAGQFCNALYAKENNANNPKRIYASVNLTGNLNNFSEQQYHEVIQHMALHFWGRELTQQEISVLSASRIEFYESLTAAQRGQTASLRNFLLFTCSGMLASFDTIVL